MATSKNTGTVKFIRVETASADTRVECAGALWAGASELPADNFTAIQLQALREHPELKVTDTERQAEGLAS